MKTIIKDLNLYLEGLDFVLRNDSYQDEDEDGHKFIVHKYHIIDTKTKITFPIFLNDNKTAIKNINFDQIHYDDNDNVETGSFSVSLNSQFDVKRLVLALTILDDYMENKNDMEEH